MHKILEMPVVRKRYQCQKVNDVWPMFSISVEHKLPRFIKSGSVDADGKLGCASPVNMCDVLWSAFLFSLSVSSTDVLFSLQKLLNVDYISEVFQLACLSY